MCVACTASPAWPKASLARPRPAAKARGRPKRRAWGRRCGAQLRASVAQLEPLTIAPSASQRLLPWKAQEVLLGAQGDPGSAAKLALFPPTAPFGRHCCSRRQLGAAIACLASSSELHPVDGAGQPDHCADGSLCGARGCCIRVSVGPSLAVPLSRPAEGRLSAPRSPPPHSVFPVCRASTAHAPFRCRPPSLSAPCGRGGARRVSAWRPSLERLQPRRLRLRTRPPRPRGRSVARRMALPARLLCFHLQAATLRRRRALPPSSGRCSGVPRLSLMPR